MPVQRGDQLGLECDVVAQKHDAFSSLVEHRHPTHSRGVVLAGIENRQHTGLIAQHRRAAAIRRMGLAPLELGVALGTGHKESLCLVNAKQTREVRIAPIQKLECTLLNDKIVQDVDLERFAIGDVNETGSGATQVQQRGPFDGCLGSTKRCPWEHRQAKVDDGGIERVGRGIQVEAKPFFGVPGAGYGDEVLCWVRLDLPRSGGVCVGRRVTRYRLAVKARVVHPSGLGSQIDFDIAQRFASGQVEQAPWPEIDLVRRNHGPCARRDAGQMCSAAGMHELRKHEFALVHTGLQRTGAKDSKSGVSRSSRHQTRMPNSASKSLTYEAST